MKRVETFTNPYTNRKLVYKSDYNKAVERIKDLDAKIQFLLDYCGYKEFTFPDGETYVRPGD